MGSVYAWWKIYISNQLKYVVEKSLSEVTSWNELRRKVRRKIGQTDTSKTWCIRRPSEVIRPIRNWCADIHHGSAEKLRNEAECTGAVWTPTESSFLHKVGSPCTDTELQLFVNVRTTEALQTGMRSYRWNMCSATGLRRWFYVCCCQLPDGVSARYIAVLCRVFWLSTHLHRKISTRWINHRIRDLIPGWCFKTYVN